MASVVNLFDSNGYYYVGFFGVKLSSNNMQTISPSITAPGATVVSTNPNTFGSTFPTWNSYTGGWVNWNPSPAIIPTSSTVVYAALLWATAYYPVSSKPAQEVTADTHAITLVKPDGTSYQITPNPAYNLNFQMAGGWWQYTHGADITSIMQDNQYGHYFFTNIITGAISGAWGQGGLALYIVYSNPLFPYRNVNLNATATGFNQTFTIPNLSLPVSGPVNARVFVSSVQGDRGYPDSLLLNGSVLSGPFNPANDFMNDRYVDYTGLALQNIGSLMVETGSDYGYFSDQTVIDNSTALTNTDTNAVITQRNSTDWAGVSQIGLMVDLNAANLSPVTKSVDKTTTTAGDTLTYTINFTNTGSTTAINANFLDTLPTGTSFISNSLTINSTPSSGDVTTGVSLPDIGVGNTITLTFKIQTPYTTVTSMANNFGNIAYKFIPTGTTPISNSVTSNIASTTILPTPISSTKSVDKDYSIVGDTLTYSISVFTGTASGINFIDTIPSGTSFISNSLTLNGASVPGSPLPPTGVDLGTVPGPTATITFKVAVTTITTTNPILNSGYVNLSYYNEGLTTNIVATTIVNANLISTKSVSETNGFVGDILTYTITIANSGDITANNVLFIDTIPDETTFVPNSFTINGLVQPGISPAPPGTVIPDIGPNKVTTLTFNVIIDTIPTPNPTTNISTTGYTFTISTSTVVNSVTNNSNMVGTFVNSYDNPLKIVDKNYGSVGDTLTYTIRYINDSSITLTSVAFFDTIPNGTTFIPGSITVNGVANPGTVAPPTGITLPDIAPNAIGTVVFQVTVNTLPTPNPIPNEGFFKFTPFGTTNVASVYSNTVTTEINEAIISPTSKTVDQVFAGLGDVLTYTINLYNSGNVTALNVVVSDTIPNGTTFVTNSITLNGVPQSGSTIAPLGGFTVGTIPVGETSTVAFKVTVVSIPTPNPTPNTATIIYDYVLYSATGTLGSGSNNTNTVNTTVYAAEVFSPVKAVDKAYTSIPSTLTYTITLVNTGNTTALNLIFSDTIPTGTTFVPNSVTLNGVTQSGAVVAPPGFTVGTLAAGATATITFQVTVTTIPNPNPILNSGTTNYSYVKNPVTSATGSGSGNTNTASTLVNYADLSGTIKSVDSQYSTCGDILTYVITIPNTGNVSAFNVFIQDTIPVGTVFVPNSVTVNGVTQIGSNPSIGVTIPSIDAGATATLSFEVQVQC